MRDDHDDDMHLNDAARYSLAGNLAGSAHLRQRCAAARTAHTAIVLRYDAAFDQPNLPLARA